MTGWEHTNRTEHGVSFLGCRVLPDGVELNRTSRVRCRRKARLLERLFEAGRIDEAELQRRGTAFFAHLQAGGCHSWNFRQCLLQEFHVDGH